MKTIRGKLIVGLCAISFVICLLLTGTNSIMLYRTAQQGMDTSVSVAAQAYAESVSQSIKAYMVGAEATARIDGITDPSLTLEEKREILAKQADKYGFIDISVSDANGKTYNDTDISDRAYFQHAMKGETYISSPVIRKTDGSIIMFVATKIDNNTGYNGIIYAALDNNVFSRIIKAVSIGEKGYGMVIDKAGTIVAHKDNSKVEALTNYITLAKDDASYSDLGNFITTMMNNQTGTVSITDEGSDKYVAYTPINNTDGWILAMMADTGEMLASYRNGLNTSIVVTIVFLVLSFLFALLLANSIGNPLSLITKRLELLSSGDLHTAVPKVKSKDETHTLAVSLEHTVSSLSSYIQDIHQVLSNISSGNLNVNTNQEYVGDFVHIKSDMEGIIDSLNQTMANISSAADQVSSGSVMISNSSLALSEGATVQASSVEELTASVEEIAAQTSLNAQNAEKANQLATNAKKEAENGNAQMSDLLRAMDAINASSGSINKIIKVIDDIAFQTNILALNAAVEAARAGQHGKGFAVVAEEVRTLAGKSANAAKETTDMIAGSIKNVETGIKIANATAGALKKIVTEVSNATDLVGSIAIASKEQAIGIEQINQGLAQVSQVVQNNAGTSEESAAASEELSSQAEQLKEVVSFFKVRNENSFVTSNPAARFAKSPSTAQSLPANSARKKISLDGDFGKY